VLAGLHRLAIGVGVDDLHAAAGGAHHFHRLGMDEGRRSRDTQHQHEPRQNQAGKH
jgi:hypothetical protein